MPRCRDAARPMCRCDVAMSAMLRCCDAAMLRCCDAAMSALLRCLRCCDVRAATCWERVSCDAAILRCQSRDLLGAGFLRFCDVRVCRHCLSRNGAYKYPMPYTDPVAYLITFTCYGTHLHGDDPYSVDRNNQGYLQKPLEPNPYWQKHEQDSMRFPPYELSDKIRPVVLQCLVETCRLRSWKMYAAHVRTNHVHVVVSANVAPEIILSAFKSNASRMLNQMERGDPDRKRWTRHGSTVYLWKDEDVASAVNYVVRGQGEAMSVFERISE